jgi:hypothetical protein
LFGDRDERYVTNFGSLYVSIAMANDVIGVNDE